MEAVLNHVAGVQPHDVGHDSDVIDVQVVVALPQAVRVGVHVVAVVNPKHLKRY